MGPILFAVAALIVSLVVAQVAAFALAQFFLTGDEFALVTVANAAIVVVSMAAYALVYAFAGNVRALALAAIALALIACGFTAWSGVVAGITSHSTNPYTFGVEDTYVRLELVAPALLAILVQWGMMRYRWLSARGRRTLSEWPWITTVIAALVLLNPIGLSVLAAAIAYSPSDWLRDLSVAVALGGLATLIVLAGVEYYMRRRWFHRRSTAGASV